MPVGGEIVAISKSLPVAIPIVVAVNNEHVVTEE